MGTLTRIAFCLALAACAGGASSPDAAPTSSPDAAPTSSPDAEPAPSTCQNGVLDPGEQCDADSDCSRRERCDPTCACVALDPPPPPTSQVLVDDDYRAGKIDLGTALLYRAYADFNDPRLPEAYDGIGPESEDVTLLADIAKALPGLPAAEQAALAPFTVRPNDPTSVFSTGYGATGGAAGVRAAVPATDCTTVSGCEAGWQSADSDHFRVWSCGDDPSSAQVSAYAEALYGPEVQLMGPPKDDTIDNDSGPARVDIYLVELNQSRSRNGTCQTVPSMSQPAGAFIDPAQGDKASGFMYVLSPYAGHDLKSTIAHEFFHILEFAHSTDATRSWLREACAVWAQTFFVPGEDTQTWVYNSLFASTTGGTNDFIDRMKVPLDRTWTGGANGYGNDISYNAFIYPFFAAQEAGFNVIPHLWQALEHAGSPNGAFNQVFGWTAHYKDFILRNINDNAVTAAGLKRYKDYDSLFSEVTWDKIPGSTSTDKGDLANGGMIMGAVELPYLTAQYEHFTIQGDTTKEITFDFTQVNGGGNLDVELLLETDKGGLSWKHVSMAGMRKYTLCTETDPPNVYEARIAIGNHDWQGEQKISGLYKVTSKSHCCPAGQTCYSGNVQVASNIATPYGTIHGTISADVTWGAIPEDPTGSTFIPISGSATYAANGEAGPCAVTLPATTFPIAPNEGTLNFIPGTNPEMYVANGSTAGPAGSLVTYHFDCPVDQGGSFDLPGDVKPWLLMSVQHQVNPDGSLTGTETHADGISYTWSFSR